MSSAAAILAKRTLKRVAQQSSHAHLSQDFSASLPPPFRSRRGHLDAIVVPATRPASFLQPAIQLAASLDVLLVVLCSRQSRVEQVAHRLANTPGARGLIVPITAGWTHPVFPWRTSDPAFDPAKAGRSSDLSLKRNLGLLLARSHGWNKIVFVDDDIRFSRTESLARLMGQLESHQIAGMLVRRFPDNSVVCHARRLAGRSQDVFLTGAVLGVRCNSLPLSFFPDIYNEDWFFFARQAASRRLPQVGQALQTEYDPFATTIRARCEEFGDLLAEGLFSWLGERDDSMSWNEMLRRATRDYWSQFIEARRQVIFETETDLLRFADRDLWDRRVQGALASLAAARNQLDATITPDLCVDFLEAWRGHLYDWQRYSKWVNNLEALDRLWTFWG